MAKGAVIGALRVTLGADTAQFEKAMTSSQASWKGAALAATAAATAVVGAVAAIADVRGAREFGAALSEVSTLLPEVGANMGQIETAARDMARAFGTTATDQARSFYQAISAGASTVEQATAVLDAANRVAIGGVTDTATAVDVLTTATNAYAATGLTAKDASDALFVGMRAGKTTIGEMASALGNVIPLAASLDVNFDQLVASVAALTTQGQSTSQAVTGVRAILAQVVKPTAEAAKRAKALGLEFNATALKAKGLSGFLADVIDKTGGNVDAMGQLFGSIEALNAVLSFVGGGGEKFTGILTDMSDKAGAAQEAFERMSQSADQRLNVAMARLGDVAIRLGDAVLTVIVPAMETFADVVEAVSGNVGDLAFVLAPIAGVHLINMVSGLAAVTQGMNLAAVAARGLSLAMAFVGGPIGLALAALAAGFLLLRDNVSAAEAATQTAQGAYKTNEQALNANKSASEGFSSALRNQIAMQVEATRAAYTLADAEFEAANRRRQNLELATGIRFGPFRIAENNAAAEADALGNALANLETQLATVDANIKTTTETTTKLATAAGTASKNVASLPLNLLTATKGVAEINNTFNLASTATKGFVSDLQNGLRQGEGFWKSFGTAATNVLNKITDALLNQVIDAVFQVGNAGNQFGGSAGFGGFIGNLFSGLFSGAGGANTLALGSLYSKGGVFGRGGVTPFANGGVVGGPTMFPFANGVGLMGEAGPEAIMPLRRDGSGNLGVLASGAGNAGPVEVRVRFFDGDNNEVEPKKATRGGNSDFELYLDQVIGKKVTQRGSSTHSALAGSFGLSSPLAGR